jgi:Ras association domain-containing protein 9/10
VHPKSSKSSIERLMSLILEQGETIQHQLTKLRDREIQISQLEEQKHRLREQEHGKNYLLETYLNGLHEAEAEEGGEKDLSSTTIHSDSGVNTEEAQSPNGGTSPTGALVGDPEMGHPTQHTKKKPHFEYSERENELLREHLKLKATPPVTEAAGECSQRPRQEVEDQIGVLEKIYAINKHLQREEELLVRLNAKIKRYESENPNLGEDEILDTLNRLNSEIEQRTREIEITNREIELSDQLLHKKALFLYGSLV